MKKLFGGLVLALLLAAFMPGTTVRAEDARVIADGVFIGPVDVSGMTVTQAENAVDAYVNGMSEKEITLSAGEDKNLDITGADTGVYWNNRKVATEAYALGHQGNIIARYKALKDLKKNNHVYDLELGFNEEALSEIAGRCADSFDQETVNYSLKKTEDGFEVSQGQTGYLVDPAETVTAIKNYMGGDWKEEGNTIQISVKADEPKGSAEELAKVRDVLGTFTTSYKTSGAARSANVANGCSLINGHTIYPGEEFSVLEAITPFSEANGYHLAGSYLNGLVVESLGGGICQVSTTLYNAVLLAELEVTERHNHSMIVTYVSPSADAAIAESGGKNFKFVNSTDSPIYIEGYTTEDKHITFTVYGVETRPAGRKVSFESEVLETTPASADQFVTDPSQAVGYVGTQSAHLGYKAQLWKIVTENGEVTEKEVVNSSTYKMVPKIVTVGTAGADETVMSQLQTAIATGDAGTVKAVAGAIAAARGAVGTDDAEAAQQAANDAVNAAHAQLQQQAQENSEEPQDTSEVIVTN
ncbi:MAG: VanW family protein [Butyrivibrio sp.]|nr:VanW family protein [Butyrivibrio sp.]